MAFDTANDLILVTAASGKQGSALLPFLTSTWKRLRLQCVSNTSKDRLRRQFPDAEVVQCRFEDIADARMLMQGVSACVLVTPAFHPRETTCGLNMIDAAAESFHANGPFRHMVLSSVLHCSLRALANHDSKRFVEEALVESDLPYTIVQPSHMMDNVPLERIMRQAKPTFYARFDPDVKFSFTAAHDLGEAIANILKYPEQHTFAIYPLISTSRPMNYLEAIKTIAMVSGEDVEIQRLTLEENASGFAATVPDGTDENVRDAILRAFKRLMVYYETRGLVGNSSVMELVLGRRPLEYKEWVTMRLQAIRLEVAQGCNQMRDECL